MKYNITLCDHFQIAYPFQRCFDTATYVLLAGLFSHYSSLQCLCRISCTFQFDSTNKLQYFREYFPVTKHIITMHTYTNERKIGNFISSIHIAHWNAIEETAKKKHNNRTNNIFHVASYTCNVFINVILYGMSYLDSIA